MHPHCPKEAVPSWRASLHETTRPAIILLTTFFSWWAFIITSFAVPARAWGTAIVTSALVGTALNANAYHAPLQEYAHKHQWAIARFYVIPFCVSSYSAVANANSFVALFPVENVAVGINGIAIALSIAAALAITRTASAPELAVHAHAETSVSTPSPVVVDMTEVAIDYPSAAACSSDVAADMTVKATQLSCA